MFKKTLMMGGALAVALSISPGVYAKVSAAEAERLKNELTPFGAERAGNGKSVDSGEGIPAWTGGLTKDNIPSTYTKAGQHHPDPYADDKILFTITAQNMDQYADKLTDGQKAMFEAYPDTFKMNIYPSRRSHSAPDWVNDNTFNNAKNAEVIPSGVGIDNGFGGIPFPIPSGSNADQALQIIWNHIVRWRGLYVVRRASEVAVQRNGSYSLATSQQEVFFNFYNPDVKTTADLDNLIFFFLSFTKSPARLAGGAVLVHETLDQKQQPRQAWGYNAGQRRVRRAPNLAYDTPIAAADGLRTADDTDMYNGSPDRYDWSYVGKEEKFIAYNSYLIDSPDLKYKDMLEKGHIDPEYARYELHRVHIVDGDLKQGKRHIYSKRRFYIDEDSWQTASIDQYDSRGELWRVSVAHIKNYYEVPATWSALDTYHDLRSKRYHVQFLDNEEPALIDFSKPIPKASYFKPSALRRRGRR